MPPVPKKKAPTTSTDAWKSKKASASALESFEAMFTKDMGPGVLSRSDKIVPYEVIPTGSLSLDYALKIGGYAHGRVGEVWGPEHAGKTTLLMLAVASAQRTYPDKMCAWVDMEQTFDKKWAASLGVNLRRLWLIDNPRSAEDVADHTKRFVVSGFCSLVVVDSIGGMISKAEFDKESDESVVANVARIVTRMVKQCSPIGKANGTTTIVVNQVRANISKYGGDQTTGGGWALKHVTSFKLKVSRGASDPKMVNVDGKPQPVGFEISVKVEKNKCAPYGTVANFWLFNQSTDQWGPVGVDSIPESYEFGLRFGIIGGKGTAWNTLPNGEKFNGKEPTIDYLRAHPDVVEEIRLKVLDTLAGQIHEEEPVIETDDDGDPLGIAGLAAAQK